MTKGNVDILLKALNEIGHVPALSSSQCRKIALTAIGNYTGERTGPVVVGVVTHRCRGFSEGIYSVENERRHYRRLEVPIIAEHLYAMVQLKFDDDSLSDWLVVQCPDSFTIPNLRRELVRLGLVAFLENYPTSQCWKLTEVLRERIPPKHRYTKTTLIIGVENFSGKLNYRATRVVRPRQKSGPRQQSRSVI